MNQFKEPTTLEEAQDRRQAIVTEMTQLQSQISVRKGDPACANWCQDAVREVMLFQAELGFLKSWLQTFRREHQKSLLAGEDRGTVCARARNAVAQMIELVNGMAREIAELNAENAKLRDRLREHAAVAPGSDIDEWREP